MKSLICSIVVPVIKENARIKKIITTRISIRLPRTPFRDVCSNLPNSPPAPLKASGFVYCSGFCQNDRRIDMQSEKKSIPTACFADANFLFLNSRKKEVYINIFCIEFYWGCSSVGRAHGWHS